MTWLVYAVIAAILTSAATIIQKKTLFKEHAMEYSAVLSTINFVIVTPLLFKVDFLKLELVPMVLLFAISILASVAFLLIAKSNRHMEVSAVSPLMVLGPGFTALLAFFFLDEALSMFQIIGIGLLIVGSYILETKSHHSLLEPIGQLRKSKYIHYILIALLFYAVCSVCDRIILSQYKMQIEAYIVFVHLFIAINFLVMMSIFHDGVKGIEHGIKKSGWWILLVSILVVGYRTAQTKAVSMAYVGLVVAIKRSSALFTTLIGGGIFHENNLIRKCIACLIILSGAIFIAIF